MQLKRKEPVDAVSATDLDNVVPSKKLKPSWEHPLQTILEESSVPIVEDTTFLPEVCPVEVPGDALIGNGPPPRLFVTEPDSDERALVLYKPVAKPTYVSSFPHDYKDFQVSSAVDWFSPSKSFRHLGNGSTNNSLAVIPYTSAYMVYSDCAGARPGTDTCGGRVIIEDITDQVQEEENADPMAVEDTSAPMEADVAEDMDIMDESPPQVFQVEQPSFGAPPPPQWQRFGSQQYTPVLW